MDLAFTHGMELPLSTARGKNIPNWQCFALAPSDRFAHELFDEKYSRKVGIEKRSEPNPRYNCHGLTLASRRTGITDEGALNDIIADDGYSQISSELVLPGDLIIYYNGEDGTIEHTGIVLSKPSANNLNIPIIYSKWGKWHELIHPANSCPYNFENVKYFRVIR